MSFEIGYTIALKSYRRLRHGDGDGERLLERNNKPEREKSPTKIAIVSLTRFIKLPQVSGVPSLSTLAKLFSQAGQSKCSAKVI